MYGGGVGGGVLGGGGGTVGPTSQVCGEGGGGGGGGGCCCCGGLAVGPHVAVGTAAFDSMSEAVKACSAWTASSLSECRPVGARVRWRAARTLRSI
ncbi:MAG: hypothetical protein E6J40_11900 [Chloroflexi bacterium]|nr:MAG: hypothetical protein E6J40_11900 [Chloroflexota bacterium]